MTKRLPKNQIRRERLDVGDRFDRVIEAAHDLFIVHGYAGVSLEMIVTRAGGSYRDIYDKFGSKEKLFLQVMEKACTEIVAPLRQAMHINLNEERRSTEEVLLRMGSGILKMLLRPASISLIRLMYSEAPRFPKLARTFFAVGPATANAIVAEYLRTQPEFATLSESESLCTAEVFTGAIVHRCEVEAMLCGTPSEALVQERVHNATQIFLNGFGHLASTSLICKGLPKRKPKTKATSKEDRLAATDHACLAELVKGEHDSRSGLP